MDPSSDDAYVTIPAHSSVAVNHTLAALYDFQSAGTGVFSFSPLTRFQLGGEDASAEVESKPVSVEITSDVASRKELKPLLSTPSCSDASRQQLIASTLSDARAAAGGTSFDPLSLSSHINYMYTGAATDIQSHPTSSQFRTYFGNNAWNTPWYTLDRIAGDLSSSGVRTLNCVDTHNVCAGNSGIVAYTWLVTSGGNIVGSDIFFCPVFFSSAFQPISAICSGAAFSSTRGNVLVHEVSPLFCRSMARLMMAGQLSHAVAGTLDTVYGCSGAAALSDAAKLTNADNYAVRYSLVWEFECVLIFLLSSAWRCRSRGIMLVDLEQFCSRERDNETKGVKS